MKGNPLLDNRREPQEIIEDLEHCAGHYQDFDKRLGYESATLIRSLLEPATLAESRLLAAEKMLGECRQVITGDMTLMCAPGESDRDCYSRHKGELLKRIDAALASQDNTDAAMTRGK